VLRSDRPVAVLFGGPANRARGLRALARIAESTGARVYGEYFPARIERGAGLPHFERIGYLPEQVQQQLAGVEHVVLAGARSPVSFFAYPGVPSDLVPAGTAVHRLAGPGDDALSALDALADALAPGRPASVPERALPEAPGGELTVWSMAQAVAAVLPEQAIVVDEANTSGLALPEPTAAASRHDWLALTGGAIGSGMPLATGAAVAAPERPVLCLEADGSALYTIQALAAQAREGLNVTTLLVNNRAYAILRMELGRLVGDAGPRAADLVDLGRPELDFCALSRGMVVPASRATTAEELVRQLRAALAEPGPHLVEALVPPLA
jgi:acetolactate synthase-1/2/3 large subunit